MDMKSSDGLGKILQTITYGKKICHSSVDM